jgi:Yip1 domain
MTDMSNEPMVPESKPTSFFQTWITALTKPNEQTYATLATSPEANANKAYLWVFLAALLNFFFASLVQGAVMRNTFQQFGGENGFLNNGFGGGLITVLCGAPLSTALYVLYFAISVAIIQWIAKMFKGSGNNNQLVYTFGAIQAPYMLIASVLTLLSAIPFAGLCFSGIAIIGYIYIFVLKIMAVKGVNQFGWGEAAGSVLIPFIVFVILCSCLTIGTLLILGPMIGNVFSTINQSLGGF